MPVCNSVERQKEGTQEKFLRLKLGMTTGSERQYFRGKHELSPEKRVTEEGGGEHPASPSKKVESTDYSVDKGKICGGKNRRKQGENHIPRDKKRTSRKERVPERNQLVTTAAGLEDEAKKVKTSELTRRNIQEPYISRENLSACRERVRIYKSRRT